MRERCDRQRHGDEHHCGERLTGGTITTSGTIAVDPASTTLTGNFFRQSGNAFGTTGVLGTNDSFALDVRVNGARVMRFEPNGVTPNVVGGHAVNFVTAGVRGATIGGGGRRDQRLRRSGARNRHAQLRERRAARTTPP